MNTLPPCPKCGEGPHLYVGKTFNKGAMQSVVSVVLTCQCRFIYITEVMLCYPHNTKEGPSYDQRLGAHLRKHWVTHTIHS